MTTEHVCADCCKAFGSPRQLRSHQAGAHHGPHAPVPDPPPALPRSPEGPLGWLRWSDALWLGLGPTGEVWRAWRP